MDGRARRGPGGGGILAKGPAAVPRYAYRDADPALLDRVRAIAAACERHGVPLGAAALQSSLREPRIDATVVGVSTPERLEQTHLPDPRRIVERP